jgi:5S rRNA maturation endonuclease (ribonuclease M5)
MQYKFKDFSTGRGGNKADLVRLLFNLDYPAATRKMIDDYNNFIKQGGNIDIDFKPAPKWKIDFIKYKTWSVSDRKYWLNYRIGKTMLETYNVKPIDYFTISIEENGEFRSLRVGAGLCYGYLDKQGEVYKIYQPRSKSHKFHKVKDYIQGIDQLKYNQPYLIICSSLKDAMCLKGMGYNIEVIAPDSENTIIKPHIISLLKKKYKKIITLFDNDQAGKQAIKRYMDTYKIEGCTPTICKDISDAMKTYGFEKTHAMIKPILKDVLNK